MSVRYVFTRPPQTILGPLKLAIGIKAYNYKEVRDNGRNKVNKLHKLKLLVTGMLI